MNKLELKALGKINLGLDVLGVRENGYHDVRMIMQTIYLYDEVTLYRMRRPGIKVASSLYFLPDDENNIAYKAAQLLIDEFNLTEGISITLKKHIPVSAGMAGGSADAAAVLFGMNRMFSLGLNDQELMKRGVRLGADVPYCLMRGTVLAEGIGEELTALPSMPRCYIIIAKPPVNVSTKWVYDRIDAKNNLSHPDIGALIKGLEKGDLLQIAAAMGNVLEEVTVEAYPVIEELKILMREAGALNAIMSGSGPTVFGIFTDRRTARNAYYRIKEKNIAKQIHVTNVYNVRRR